MSSKAYAAAIVLMAIVGVGLFATGVYAQWFGPCSWFKGVPITQVPSRCIKEIDR